MQLHEAVLDVTPAQGGWEEELGKEGGAAEKKEVALSPPESSLLCFCNRLRLHLLFFFCWDMGYQGYPAVRCPLPFPKFGAPSPIADIRTSTSPSFLARPSPATRAASSPAALVRSSSTRLRLRSHHSTADVQHQPLAKS